MPEHHGRVYFTTWFDKSGVFHVSPKDGVELMAIKHLLYEIGEHTMEKMVVFDTDVPIALGSDPKTY